MTKEEMFERHPHMVKVFKDHPLLQCQKCGTARQYVLKDDAYYCMNGHRERPKLRSAV